MTDRRTNEQTDICTYRVAFATEKLNIGLRCLDIKSKLYLNMAGFIFNLEKESEISQEYQYLGFVFVHGGWRMENGGINAKNDFTRY